ncbi:MAG: hypothetical protein AVDCRST_MAG41-4376, partial [uncultured Corynebacteriales bacterium]
CGRPRRPWRRTPPGSWRSAPGSGWWPSSSGWSAATAPGCGPAPSASCSACWAWSSPGRPPAGPPTAA